MRSDTVDQIIPEPESRAEEDSILFVAASPAMRALTRVIQDVAPTDIPVLLLGECGTGKEVVAFQIHRFSQRCKQPFLKLRCSTATPSNLNGRWRGHGKSAESFPGSLFLDELSELDAACQPKLLHLLPDGVPARPRSAFRLISASSRNLEEEMRAGRFREELYYRINGVCLRLPPLRQRVEDIQPLADFFLRRYAARFGRPQPALSAAALRVLLNHIWPGNIRELENTMKKIVALGDEALALADLAQSPPEMPGGNGGGEGISLKQVARAASRQAERELILRVLGHTRWNRKRAAQELHVSYKALLYKLKQIGLNDRTIG